MSKGKIKVFACRMRAPCAHVWNRIRNSKRRKVGEREEGRKGGRENGGRNGMLLVRICWGPARGRFAGSGGFGF